MGHLSTHVLDVSTGASAPGIEVRLSYLAPDGGTQVLARATTNADGRTDEPLLTGSPLRVGVYELLFHLGDYFRARTTAGLADPPFLDEVPVRFAVADPAGHYHVPLLISPWSYSTYRGS